MSSLPQVDLLYLTSTGHVLASFTRASEPAQLETDLSGFLGSDGFYLSGFGPAATVAAFDNQVFIVPANQVGLTSMAWDPVGVVSPRQLGVPVTAPMPNPVTTISLGNAAAITNATLPLTIGAGVVVGTSYTLLIYGPLPNSTSPATPVQVTQGKLAAGGTIAITGLTTGQKYFAVAFFSGQQVAVGQFTA